MYFIFRCNNSMYAGIRPDSVHILISKAMIPMFFPAIACSVSSTIFAVIFGSSSPRQMEWVNAFAVMAGTVASNKPYPIFSRMNDQCYTRGKKFVAIKRDSLAIVTFSNPQNTFVISRISNHFLKKLEKFSVGSGFLEKWISILRKFFSMGAAKTASAACRIISIPAAFINCAFNMCILPISHVDAPSQRDVVRESVTALTVQTPAIIAGIC